MLGMELGRLYITMLVITNKRPWALIILSIYIRIKIVGLHRNLIVNLFIEHDS